MKTIRAFDDVISTKKDSVSRKNKFNSIEVYLDKQLESLRKDRNFYRIIYYIISFFVLLANVSLITISVILIAIAAIEKVEGIALVIVTAVTNLISVIFYFIFNLYSRNNKARKCNEAYKLIQFLYLEHKFSRNSSKDELWLIEKIEKINKFVNDKTQDKRKFKELLSIISGDKDEQ